MNRTTIVIVPRAVRHRVARMRRTFLALALALSATACTHVQPWERGKLAHPTMTTMGEPSPALEHVYSVQEGSVGGAAEAAGGCGCN